MTAPSLFDTPDASGRVAPAIDQHIHTLLDGMYDGFYLLFLLKARHAPPDAELFRDRVKAFLTAFERAAGKIKASADDIHACKYAFCATLDECMLTSQFNAKAAWQRQPLQVQLFGEQLAGEQFFDMLEELRRVGAPRLQALEVFHMCLLLGFQGKYRIDGSEKLAYLSARLGDEIARIKGHSAELAPHWAAPDRVAHRLRHELPLWVVWSVVGLVAMTGFVGLRWHLTEQTKQRLGTFHRVVELAPQTAHITVTLP